MCVLQNVVTVGSFKHVGQSAEEAHNVGSETSLTVGIGRHVAQSVLASPCVYHSLPIWSGVINT